MKKHTQAQHSLTDFVAANAKANGNPADTYILLVSNFGNHHGLDRVASSTNLNALMQLVRNWHLVEHIADVQDYMETHNQIEIYLSQPYPHKYYTYNKLVIERIQTIY
jgi:hypothetical protein